MTDQIKPLEGPQALFLSTTADIALYGGAAGGGKTHALLMEGARYSDIGDAGAVFFRRNSTQITNEGGLWDEAIDMYMPLGGDPRQSPNYSITFKSGFKCSFRHLQYDKDVFSYQGAQIPIQLWDELTHFTKKQFVYMLSRNRSMSGIKPYVRATCNPDKSSWVRELVDWWIGKDGYPIQERSGVIRWFINFENQFHWFESKALAKKQFPDLDALSFTFIPSKLTDNKILMEKDPGYKAKLMALSRVDRERLLGGNWDVMPSAGMYFKQFYFHEVDSHPPLKKIVRAWDRAATEHKEGDSGDPDWTVGLKMGVDADGFYYILDIVRERLSPFKVEQLIKATASQDGRQVIVKAFQDPGAAGKNEADQFIRMMAGYIVKVDKISVNKETAAKAVSAQAEAGNIKMLSSCRNKAAFYSETEDFPEGKHDDIVDALSSAFNTIALGPKPSYTKEMKNTKIKTIINRSTKDKW